MKKNKAQCWMVTIANHPFYGGGMKIIPDAIIKPDTCSIVILHSISKWKVLLLFIKVFSGKHVDFKEVEIIKARYMEITTNKEVYYHVDGQTDLCTTCSLYKQSDPISVIGSGVAIHK